MTSLQRPPLPTSRSPLALHERTVGDVAIIEVVGPLTSDTGATLLTERVEALMSQGFSRIVLDLNQVTYMDSAGLGGLIRSYSALARTSGALRLLGVTPRLQHVLAITNLVSIFETHDEETSALASFGPPSVAALTAADAVVLADAV